jgi:hypothetical protein
LCQLQIGACGTVRVISAGFPKRHEVPKAKKLACKTLSGIVVGQPVFAIVWIDIAPAVKHHLQATGASSFNERTRWRPYNTNSNSQIVRATFNGKPRLQPQYEWRRYRRSLPILLHDSINYILTLLFFIFSPIEHVLEVQGSFG